MTRPPPGYATTRAQHSTLCWLREMRQRSVRFSAKHAASRRPIAHPAAPGATPQRDAFCFSTSSFTLAGDCRHLRSGLRLSVPRPEGASTSTRSALPMNLSRRLSCSLSMRMVCTLLAPLRESRPRLSSRRSLTSQAYSRPCWPSLPPPVRGSYRRHPRKSRSPFRRAWRRRGGQQLTAFVLHFRACRPRTADGAKYPRGAATGFPLATAAWRARPGSPLSANGQDGVAFGLQCVDAQIERGGLQQGVRERESVVITVLRAEAVPQPGRQLAARMRPSASSAFRNFAYRSFLAGGTLTRRRETAAPVRRARSPSNLAPSPAMASTEAVPQPRVAPRRRRHGPESPPAFHAARKTACDRQGSQTCSGLMAKASALSARVGQASWHCRGEHYAFS